MSRPVCYDRVMFVEGLEASILIKMDIASSTFTTFRTVDEVRELIRHMQVACDQAEAAEAEKRGEVVHVNFAVDPGVLAYEVSAP
ncbi:MAG: hypothetical protein JWP29_1953 [Rhodoferax sp.]|nr:hypothetical protein [Rhodoferax sp.]